MARKTLAGAAALVFVLTACVVESREAWLSRHLKALAAGTTAVARSQDRIHATGLRQDLRAMRADIEQLKRQVRGSTDPIR